MRSLNDLAGVLSSRMLRRRTPLGDSCMEIAGSYGIRSWAPMIFWPFGFIGNVTMLYYLLPSWDTSFTVYGEVRAKNDMQAEFWGLAIVVRVCGDEKLYWWFSTHSSGIGELHWVPHACRLLDHMGLGREHPCFFWPFDFRGSTPLLSVALMGHIFYGPWWRERQRITWKASSEDYQRWFEFMAMRNFLGDSWLVRVASASRGDNIG
jgi:hypothetical protein